MVAVKKRMLRFSFYFTSDAVCLFIDTSTVKTTFSSYLFIEHYCDFFFLVVKLFHLAPCKIRPEVEYLFNEVYLYYIMSIIFLMFSFLPSFLFFYGVFGAFL